MTKKEIKKIYRYYQVPENIISHMKKVAFVCAKIADQIIGKNFKINKKELINAALLHDVLRVVDISKENLEKLYKTKKQLILWLKLKKKYGKIGHERAMAQVLNSMNEKKLANLVKKHGFFEIYKLKTLEEKILFYSDKRVNHDQIVSLKKRFAEGRKRNMGPGDNLKFILKTEKQVFKLGKELKKSYGLNSRLFK